MTAVLNEESAVRNDTLSDQAYQRLHRSLMTGGLLPEQVLTVRGLAEAYGVSLTPVREAIQRLVAEHALVVENGRTIRVPRLDVETYREILKIRLELEPMAARDAAVRMDNAEMDRVEALAHLHREAIVAGEAHRTLAANTDFHISIYRASQQPVLTGLIESLWLRIGPTLNLLFPTYCGSLTGVEMHLEAVDALRRRDGDALARAVRDDLAHGSRFLVRLLKP
ncbi:MAG: GntR family transcriptional regulator [Ideonella sp.]|nr:GntR family transcriptional regulator [Ideonella sp.]